MKFHPTYTKRVLDPSYANWVARYQDDSLRVHRAHLVMLAERGVIPLPAAKALKLAITELSTTFTPPRHIPEGVEDLYFLFERELERIAGADTAGYLHTARSRNDMDTTVFRMSLKRELLSFLSRLQAVCAAGLARAKRAGSEPVVLFTHGQPANVSTLAHYLTAFVLELLETGKTLQAAISSVDQSTMGACAITTTGFDIEPARVSSLLGFNHPVVNSYRAISTSHWLADPADALAGLMSDVTRFAADLGHKASSEVGIVSFPEDLVQISSIMPQKRNPVIIEHIRIQAGLARGIFRGIGDMLQNVPFQDVNEAADAPVEQLYLGIASANSCLELLVTTLRAIAVDSTRVREIAVRFGTTTTELADTLVRDEQMSFRQAHGITQEFVRSGYDKSALRSGFERACGRRLTWSDARIDEILSPERFIEVRSVPGGPAPEGMKTVYAEAERMLSELDKAIADWTDGVELADRALEQAFSNI